MGEIRIVIADDHVVLRQSLAAFINTQADMKVVAQTSSGEEAVEKTGEAEPHVLLIDITMPGAGGIAAIKEVRERFPGVRSLVLTMHEDQTFLRSALAAGAAGYVTKSAAGDELLKAIHEVAQGRSYVNVSLADSDLRDLVEQSEVTSRARRPDMLSEREREVLKLVAHGYTSKQIASRLGIAPASVDTYRLRISEKLGLKHRAELVRYALDTGLMSSERPPLDKPQPE